MNTLEISLTIIGIDFDDDELPFHEEDKSNIKRANETFYHSLADKLDRGVVGNCEFALQELSRPDVKLTKSALMGTVLRIGDVDARPEEAIEILVKTSKCTALARPKSWKKFARRERRDSQEARDDDDDSKTTYAQLRLRTEYYIDRESGTDDGESVHEDHDEDMDKRESLEKVEKEQLVRGFKYGASYAPCPDGQFPRLPTRRGIEICGFFKTAKFRREQAMSEVTYVWADPAQPLQQVALSAIVQAMYEKGAMAIARWVSRDGMDPKMGVLSPNMFDKVDCLLWVQMPFADDWSINIPIYQPRSKWKPWSILWTQWISWMQEKKMKTETACHGSILGSHSIQPYTERNRHNSMQQSFKISMPIHCHPHIQNL